MFTHSITTVRLRSVGDYIHPDRKWWLAMRNDPYGPVPLTLDDLRARIQLAHANGAKCSICMHQAGFDDASSLAGKLWTPRWLTKSGKDAVLLGRVRDGRQSLFDVHSFSPVEEAFSPASRLDHGTPSAGRDQRRRKFLGLRL